MSDAEDQNPQRAVMDFIDNAVVSDTDAPGVFAPFDLDAPGWVRVICQCGDGFIDAALGDGVEPAQLFDGCAGEFNLMYGVCLGRLDNRRG